MDLVFTIIFTVEIVMQATARCVGSSDLRLAGGGRELPARLRWHWLPGGANRGLSSLGLLTITAAMAPQLLPHPPSCALAKAMSGTPRPHPRRLAGCAHMHT